MTHPSSPSPHSSHTIVALASGMGRSDRALVRLSGPQVREVLARIVPGLALHAGLHTGILTLSDEAGRSGLPCLVMLSLAPRSYTGEDIAEFLLPGSPVLAGRVIERLRREPGVREAEPGEFSAQAYLNGRLSLDQAEGVAALIGARTETQLAAARSLLSGATGSRYRAWADEASTLLALVEAGIDFTDQEDVIPIGPAALEQRLTVLIVGIESMLGAAAGAERIIGVPRIVLAGHPNSGKSTLFNALLGHERAITSPIAGTTRDAIAEELDLSKEVPCGPTIVLVDLAGLDAPEATGHTEIDRAAQEQARREIAIADAILLCDPAGRFDAPLAGDPGRPIVRVRTKADLPTNTQAPAGTVHVCALDGWNLGVLRRAIADAAVAGKGSDTWLIPRHRRTLGASLTAMRLAREQAMASPGGGLASPEVIAGQLREAVDQLGELVGRISPDDIIGRIFATFCVGK